MPTTVTTMLVAVREMLDETVEAQWTQVSLRRWLNDGLNDIARETHQLKDVATFATVASQAEYTLAANILEVDNAYFVTSDGRYVPLDPAPYEGIDQVWGQYQNQTSYQPTIYALWGFPPTLKMRLYPVPTTINTISLRIARLATQIDTTGGGDAASIDFPDGWMDTLVDYCEMRALRKDRDPRWQEVASMYQAKRDSLMLVDYTNSNRSIVNDPGMLAGVPAFISDWAYRG